MVVHRGFEASPGPEHGSADSHRYVTMPLTDLRRQRSRRAGPQPATSTAMSTTSWTVRAAPRSSSRHRPLPPRVPPICDFIVTDHDTSDLRRTKPIRVPPSTYHAWRSQAVSDPFSVGG